MNFEFKKILKQQGIFFLIGLMGPIISFLLLPLHISYFDPQEYGQLYLLYSLASLGVILSSFNLNDAIKTYYFDYQNQKLYSYIQQVILSNFIFGSLLLLLISFLGPTIIPVFFDENNFSYTPILLLALYAFLSKNIFTAYGVYLRNARENRFLIITSISYNLMFLGLQVYFIVYSGWGISSIFLAMATSSTFVVLMIVFREWPRWDINANLNFETLVPSIKYGLQLLPLVLMNWLMIKGDRWFVQDKLDLEELGVYALTMNMAILLSFVTTVFLNASRPELYQGFKNITTQKDISLVLKLLALFLGMLVVCSIGIYSLCYLIPLFSNNQKYHTIIDIVPLGLSIIALRSLIRFNNEYFECIKNTKPIVIFSFINLCIFLISIHILPLKMGVYLFFIALLISNAICLIITVGFTYNNLKSNAEE